MNTAEAIKQVIKRTLVIDNPQSIDEFTMPRIMEIVDEYTLQESREVAVRFMTELDDTFNEGTPFKDRLGEWGEVFDIWWKQRQKQK